MPHMRPVRAVLLLWAVSTVVGLLSASIVITAELASGEPAKTGAALLRELTGAYTFGALIPPLLAAFRRVPITRDTWWHAVPVHLALSMVVGATHTLLMWTTRTAGYEWLGWGSYDYGLMRFRFLMEYQKQLPAYWLVWAGWAAVAFLRRSRERELQQATLRSQLADARLSALALQLNPHFLFNTLNMIASFVGSDPARAERMIATLSDLLRESLRRGEARDVSLEDEVRVLGHYLTIMQARFADRLRVDLDVPADLLRARVPLLLLQPLVENAITHGTARQTGQGHLAIRARRTGDRLTLTVEDNGPGFDGAPADALGRGVGLTNVAERLKTLYGSDHQLDFANRPAGGARVTLTLPWQEREKAP